MRILIVTDAWAPQVNGVVRTLESTIAELRTIGHAVEIVSPDGFASIPCPTYPEIRLSIATQRMVGRRIAAANPEAVHIATEGPLGLLARVWCRRHDIAFTTAYHTQFPQYLAHRTSLPTRAFWPYIRWFHRPARHILVSTPTVAQQLAAQGLTNSRIWSRGVDLDCFRPDAAAFPAFGKIQKPLLLYVGRVAVEKNLESFLECSHPGSKIVVGDGPALHSLKKKHPAAAFIGPLQGEALASAYASADVLVFPSRTDTFGLVMIEALSCGTPVAAFPVPGPADVLTQTVGCMHRDLDIAIAGALKRNRNACAAYGQRFSWQESTKEFLAALVPVSSRSGRAAITAFATAG